MSQHDATSSPGRARHHDGSRELGGIAYLLQVFPKYSETFIANELLEHQRQGREISVLSLRLPREGRFHGCLAQLNTTAQYISESFWDDTGKVGQAVYAAVQASPRGMLRALRHCGARRVDFRDVWQAALVRRWVARRNIAHLHCHFGGFAARVAYLSRLMGGPSYSVTLHAHDIFRETVDRRLLRSVIEHSTFCVTVSEFNAAHLRMEIGDPQVKVRVLYNGIPLDRFEFSTASREPSTILAVGRLIEKKGFAQLVRACRILMERGLLRRCEIVGEGRERAALSAEIEQLDLGELVTLSGAWPQERVAEALRTASVFALPCIVAKDGNRDALPTVLLEAMASGCPIVSTRLSGIPEMVIDGESGLLVEPGDEMALANALTNLMTDPTRAAALAVEGRRRAERLFDVCASVATLGQWLDEARSGQAKPAVGAPTAQEGIEPMAMQGRTA